MTGWKNVVYRGEDTGILKNGTPYEVLGIIQKGENDSEYALKGIEGKFDSSLFQAPKEKRQTHVAISRSSNPPTKGMPLKNLMKVNENGELEPVLEEEVVTGVKVIWGDVYAVHTKEHAYMIQHCPYGGFSTVSRKEAAEAVDDNVGEKHSLNIEVVVSEVRASTEPDRTCCTESHEDDDEKVAEDPADTEADEKTTE